jgi:hypothetical protein
MANTFEPIATVSVPSPTGSITFSSIPQTYTDLCLMISARSVVAGTFSDELMSFNNVNQDYTNIYTYGNGSSAFQGSNAYSGQGGFIGGMPGNGATANTYSNKMVYIPEYTSSNYKAYSVDSAAETNATLAYIHMLAGLWSQTSAITSIVLKTDNLANYNTGTIATLYGIKKS